MISPLVIITTPMATARLVTATPLLLVLLLLLLARDYLIPLITEWLSEKQTV